MQFFRMHLILAATGMRFLKTSLILAVCFITLVFVLPVISYAQNSPSSNGEGTHIASPTVLVADLKNDGINDVDIDSSEIYFDVDGDFLAERTSWIGGDDAILWLVKQSELRDNTVAHSFRLTNGILHALDEIKAADRNGDQVYDAADFDPNAKYITHSFDNISFLLVRDFNQDGLPEESANDLVPCEVVSFSFQKEPYELTCKQGRFSVYARQLAYEDSNVIWKKLCERLSYGGARYHGSKNTLDEDRCIENGFEPPYTVVKK